MSFKEFDQSTDIATQLGVVNEVIPLTGTFFSGTEFYTKTYQNITSGSALSGGFYQTTYDGSPTSVSASALIDFTYGHSSSSLNVGFPETFENAEKQRMYQLMAQRLLGNKSTLFNFGAVDYHEVFFLTMKRRIFKDEIQKGQVAIEVQMTGTGDTFLLSLADTGAASSFSVGQAGDYAPLYSGSTAVGSVYYNAGIVAVASGAFVATQEIQPHWSGSAVANTLDRVAISGNFDHIVTGLRNHINTIQFQNQTNLHSTLYFCRAFNSEFNYSTNPTFVDSDGRIIPTSGTDNQTRTYPTTVGLYDINDNLLAVAKSSEPIKKSPDSEVTFRVKLSY